MPPLRPSPPSSIRSLLSAAPAALLGAIVAMPAMAAAAAFPAGLLPGRASPSGLAAGVPTPPASADQPAAGPSAGSHAAQPVCPLALESRVAAPSQLIPGMAAAGAPGYAGALAGTSLGWPRLDGWCVWIEPAGSGADAASARERIWHQAVLAALQAWRPLLPLQRVDDPAAAQIRVWRRRPPRAADAAGRLRASNGRALLSLLAVLRQPGIWRLEPAVEVLIDPGRRAEALQATALHELGHAIGLWGHSPDPADAMAGRPGPQPVLWPSDRDRLTLEWLQAQPSRFGMRWNAPPPP